MPDEFFENEEETDLSQFDKIALLQKEIDRLEDHNRQLRVVNQKWLGMLLEAKQENQRLDMQLINSRIRMEETLTIKAKMLSIANAELLSAILGEIKTAIKRLLNR